MPLVRPFAALRPAPEYAQQVVAPPYDVLSSDEARALAAGKPWTFLHISKPEIDLPRDVDPYAPTVYAKAHENFVRMLDQGVLRRDRDACYYVYRLTMGAHTQTGLVAAASVVEYERNRIRKHEFTRPDKEDDRVRQIDALNAQTGPVFLTYRHQAEIDRAIEELTTRAPDTDVVLAGPDGAPVRHEMWVVDGRPQVAHLSTLFNRLDLLYVADGHHRSAAAARIAGLRRATNPHHTGDEPYNYFLAVLFPDTQMQILDYNRLVKDLNGLSVEAFLQRVGEHFGVRKSVEPVKPATAGEFGLYLPGQWYRLQVKPNNVPLDPVRRLDVSLLADGLIAPVLNITDPRRDKRIDFVGGIRGLAELERRVDSGEMAAAFSLYPTSLADLMAVADAGQVMPPKSTWFEPKLADGLASHVLD